MIYIKDFEFNPFQEKTYILYDDTGSCVVVDPGSSNKEEEKQIETFISEKKLTPERVLLTHGHVDHVCGSDFLFRKYKLQPELHPEDLEMYLSAVEHGLVFDFRINPLPDPLPVLQEKKPVHFGSSSLEVFHVPGHSQGSVAFHNREQKFVLVGDVLFKDTIGRTDLPGGSLDQLLNSIYSKLFPLGDDTKVYSGHGPETNIGIEKLSNPFLT